MCILFPNGISIRMGTRGDTRAVEKSHSVKKRCACVRAYNCETRERRFRRSSFVFSKFQDRIAKKVADRSNFDSK